MSLLLIFCLGEGSWQTVTTTVTRGPGESYTTANIRGELELDKVFLSSCKNISENHYFEIKTCENTQKKQ